MIDWSDIVPPVLAGVGTGIFFFGGLLWTVRRIQDAKRPHTLVWSSFVARQVVTASVLFLVCKDQWEHWTAALIGFVVVRTLMIKGQKTGTNIPIARKG
ncbi:N-ATPase subunit AtpR [Desulfoplanes sp.]